MSKLDKSALESKQSEQLAEMKAGSFLLSDPDAFDTAKGEKFAGLNILKLKPGEAAGPFVLVNILRDQQLGDSKKKMKPVDVYVASFGNQEVRMPVAASFVGKAMDSKLGIGDTFLVKRLEDYTDKKYGRECHAYALNITARANRKNAA